MHGRAVGAAVAAAIVTSAALAPLACGPAIPTSSCDTLYDAYIAFIEKCGGPNVSTNVPDALVDDIFNAKADFVDHYCGNLAGAPGTESLGSEIDACAAALTQSICGDESAIASACALRGTLPGGARCGFSEQCASGFCSAEPANGAYGCGTCTEVLNVGDGCSPGDLCRGDAYCRGSPWDVCTAYVQEGAACDDSQQIECEPGFICDAYGTKTCVRLAATGQPCTTLPKLAPACADNGICSNGICAALPTNGTEPLPTCGEYCSAGGVPDSGFIACSCPAGSVCQGGENGPCLPTAEVGQPCGLGGCGPSHPSAGHNAWLACVNGVCQEPDLTCP